MGRMRQSKKTPAKTLRREDAFFGVHFDFHARDDCTDMGRNVTPRMVEKIIEAARPDYIQCDCKGHPGISSYPTKVGYAAPGFVKDPLKVWRRVTARHGVGLYMHYSGVWDTEAIKHHPEWARVDENGHRDPNNTSVFGPYVDELLIPQLKELRDVYGVDGVWLDGECWATCQDYSEAVLEAFRKETGITTVPKTKDDPGFHEFSQFCREGFRRYLRHYLDVLHAHDSDYQITSNWAFSSFMPEPVSADVDFISGDYSMADSLNAARLQGRCIAPQGKAWDLMAWSFCGNWGEGGWSTKSAVQLKQEAASVMAQGGGVQIYFIQNRDGSVDLQYLDLMREVAEFCRARQSACHQATFVPQIALFNSTHAFYRNNARVFSPWDGPLVPLQGILTALLESQHSVEILSEHHLEDCLSDLPMLIIPETDPMPSRYKAKLLEYVRHGGALLCVGPKVARRFQRELGVQMARTESDTVFHVEHRNEVAVLKGRVCKVVPQRGVKTLGRRLKTCTLDSESTPLCSMTRLGKGRIAAVYCDVGERYTNCRTTVMRDLLNDLVRELFPNPMVEVHGSHNVDVTVMENQGAIHVNLVNTAGPHQDSKVHVFDEIPVVGPLQVAIRLAEAPKRIVRLPAGRAVKFDYADGVARCTLAKLEIHDILRVEG